MARPLARFKPALTTPYRTARFAFLPGHKVRLFCCSADFFAALIERIDAAARSVALETYIFCDDAAGRPVSEALERAARRGVHVRVITDGIGTSRLPMFAAWPSAGIEHRIFNRHFFGYFGFSRTHRKLAIIDSHIAFCGGINLIDEFDPHGMSLQSPCWDFTLEIIGPVSAQIDAAFALQWQRIGLSLHLLMPRKDPPSVKYAKAAPRVAAHTIEQPSVAFIVRDNFFNRRAIEKAYLMAIRHAQREILLANPYFIPGRRLRRALMRAARRGVDVRLLIGRKEFMLLDCAVPHLYRTLLYAGVRIAEYEKTLLHGKVAVIDSTWATVGSSNLDALSLVLNHEANIVLVKHPEIAALREAISKAFNEARLIDAAHYAARSWGERLLNWLAYTMYRAVMKVLTIGGYD